MIPSSIVRAFCVSLLFLIIVVPASAAELIVNGDFEWGTIVIYSGSTTIKDTLATKSTDVARAAYLSSITDTKIKPIKFPYFIPDDKSGDKTVIAINGYKCTPYYCGYWISATRDKVLVQTNSPVWIYPPPYQIITSTVEDKVANSITYTVVEDPQAAMETVLRRYAQSQPLGKPTIGTPL